MKRLSIILSAVLVLAATACTKQEMVNNSLPLTKTVFFSTRASIPEYPPRPV